MRSVSATSGFANQHRTLAATSISYVVTILDASIVNVALNSMASDLATGIAGLQWIVNAYTLAFASLLLTSGLLGDRVGARKVYCSGLLIFTLASALCGLAPSGGFLIAARVAQGIGASLLVPSSLTLLNHAYHDEGERAGAIGIWAGCGGAALAAGPLVGGILVEIFGWRSIFLINIPIGALGLWIALGIDETERAANRSFDIAGQILAIATLACLVSAMIEAPAFGWLSWPIMGLAGGFCLCAALFLFVEKRRQEPMLPLDFFRNTIFSVSALTAMLTTATFFGAVFVLSLYFLNDRHYSPLATGFAFLPATAVVTICNILSGRLVKSHGARLPIVTGLLTGGAGFLGLMVIGLQASYAALAIPLLLIGIGGGLTVPPVANALIGTVAKRDSGVASGVLNTARQVGVAAGVALFGALVSGLDVIAGLTLSFAVSAVLWFGFAALAWRTYP